MGNMSNRIEVGHVWFSGRSNIGVVLGYDIVTNELMAWIHTVTGQSEEEDARDIMQWGTKFPVQEAKSLIEKFGQMVLSPEEVMNLILDSQIRTGREDTNN